MNYDFDVIARSWEYLFKEGMSFTLTLTALSMLGGVVLGTALALAFRTLNDRAGAEDVCQQAFTRLWTHGPRFDPARGSAEAWFRRILVNLCLDRRRAIRPVQPLDAAAELADHRPDPEAAAIRADGHARLEMAMARLNPRQRLKARL